jgi:BirA family biotin operon repressor/biotin-[acetyl-CoA-carboxylase] ligase
MTFRRFSRELLSWAKGSGAAVVVARRVDSTNTLARTVARRLASEGDTARRVLFVAWEQTAGRGRLGRGWASPPGLGVYATLLLLPAPSAPPLSLLPLVAGIGLCQGAREFLPGVGLKWPNDLVLGGRKLGGILIETLPSSESGAAAALIGFGLNHGHESAELPTPTSTSFRVEARDPAAGPTLVELIGTLAGRLLEAIEEHHEPEPILDAYRRLSVHRPGDPLRCRIQERSIEGSFLDFDAQGRLRVRAGRETVVIAAGDVIEGAGAGAAP